MQTISNEKFGAFLKELRAEKGLTQREVAEKLWISDKAVSKWERGLSMPEVSVLLPLSEILGVTVTELLRGERCPHETPMNITQVEELVSAAITLSDEQSAGKSSARKKLQRCLPICLAAFWAELMLLCFFGCTWGELISELSLVTMLHSAFAFAFGFLIDERLPSYYDENRISFYTNGFVRIQLPGIAFNNRNWPHILRIAGLLSQLVILIFPPVWFVIGRMFPALWQQTGIQLAVKLLFCFVVPVSVWYEAKRWE